MNMNEPNTHQESIRRFVNQAVNIDALSDDENLFTAGIVNSLFAIELMTFVERQFGLEIGEEDLNIENFKSITATAAFVTRKSASPAAAATP